MNEKYAKCILLFATFIPYLQVALNQMINGGYGKMSYMCQELPIDEFQTQKLHMVLNTIMYLLGFGSGILFDVKMIIFVKNRNKIQHIELIPWKTVDPIKAQNDMEIPVRATIASSILTIIFLILYTLYLSLSNFWHILIALNLFFIIPLPLILLLTIKQKDDDKKHKSQPPNKLQFHNENFTKGISHPLQFHEDFETCSAKSVDEKSAENDKVRQNPSVKQKDTFQPNSSENIVKSVSMESVSQNEMFDKIDVLSITEIQC